MAWRRHKDSSGFPSDMIQRLELLGRFELDHTGSGVAGSEIYPTCIGPFFDRAQADPLGFLAALRAVVADDTGGFATYGASCLVHDVLSGQHLKAEDALALLDAAIAFKHERSLPSASFKGYEWQRWLEVSDPDAR